MAGPSGSGQGFDNERKISMRKRISNLLKKNWKLVEKINKMLNIINLEMCIECFKIGKGGLDDSICPDCWDKHYNSLTPPRPKEDDHSIKAFGYTSGPVKINDYGISCGIIFAENIEEAKAFVDFDNQSAMEKYVFKIPMEKGYHFIGDHWE